MYGVRQTCAPMVLDMSETDMCSYGVRERHVWCQTDMCSYGVRQTCMVSETDMCSYGVRDRHVPLRC